MTSEASELTIHFPLPLEGTTHVQGYGFSQFGSEGRAFFTNNWPLRASLPLKANTTQFTLHARQSIPLLQLLLFHNSAIDQILSSKVTEVEFVDAQIGTGEVLLQDSGWL